MAEKTESTDEQSTHKKDELTDEQLVAQQARMWDNDNDQPFVPPDEGPEHGYWGQRASNAVPNEKFTVTEVTKDLPGPSGTATIRPGTPEAARQAEVLERTRERADANTSALRGSGGDERAGDRGPTVSKNRGRT
jgi:hypothetical protein